MKIALLTDGITPFVTGGMQRHSANLAKYFTIAGVDVTLIHCVPYLSTIPTINDVNESLFGKNAPYKLTEIVGFNFPKKGKIPGHYVRNSYQYSAMIYHSLDWSKYDFVYVKGFCGWYFMQQKSKGVVLPPIGVKFHGYEMFQKLPTLSQKIKAKMLQKSVIWNNQNADWVFSYGGCISTIITNQLNVKPQKIITNSSGIDAQWVNTKPLKKRNEQLHFVFIGRNEKRKGIVDLLKAIERLEKLFPNQYQFHFIGPINPSIAGNIRACHFHGELQSKDTLCAILDECDVLVCPSHAEGMPNVILEGMARGLAILATNVGAVPQLVDASNGLLIEPFHHQKLFDALAYFITCEILKLEQLKQASLDKVKHSYLWPIVIQNSINDIASKLNN